MCDVRKEVKVFAINRPWENFTSWDNICIGLKTWQEEGRITLIQSKQQGL